MSVPNQYFELRDDMRFPGRWVVEQTGLDDQGRQSDVWQFTRGTPTARCFVHGPNTRCKVRQLCQCNR